MIEYLFDWGTCIMSLSIFFLQHVMKKIPANTGDQVEGFIEGPNFRSTIKKGAGAKSFQAQLIQLSLEMGEAHSGFTHIMKTIIFKENYLK